MTPTPADRLRAECLLAAWLAAGSSSASTTTALACTWPAPIRSYPEDLAVVEDYFCACWDHAAPVH